MSSLVRNVAFVFAGGDAFFWGLGLLVFGAVLAGLCGGRRLRAGSRLGTLIAWIIIICSATPLPFWFYLLGGVLSLVLLMTRRRQPAERHPRGQLLVVIALIIAWCIAGAGWEISYRFRSRIRANEKFGALVVIGDSISAGMLGPKEPTWPKQFRERFARPVIDLSAEGATAHLAIRQVQALNSRYPELKAVVLIEIGGNDYFELIPPTDFSSELDSLLTLLERPNRQLLMVELPLPPFYNAYGRVQRELAAKHQIPLISKREFASVVFSRGATLDTVHLSESGHALMAVMIWRHVGRLLADR
jgi:acyl-CoA thioesterase I